jgi:hypothetical protein
VSNTTGKDKSAAIAGQAGRSAETRADNAAKQPQAREQRQQNAAHRQPTGPVWNGRQQEPRDGRHYEAEQHFVDMPCQRIEAGRQLERSEEHGEPHGDRHDGPHPCPKEHRPEGVSKYGELIRAADAFLFAQDCHVFSRIYAQATDLPDLLSSTMKTMADNRVYMIPVIVSHQRIHVQTGLKGLQSTGQGGWIGHGGAASVQREIFPASAERTRAAVRI